MPSFCSFYPYERCKNSNNYNACLCIEGMTNGVDHADGRIKPEAKDYAQKSVAGMMARFLDQNANNGYASPRPMQRIKPEAQANAERNKGEMKTNLTGYLNSPRPHDQRRVKPEAESFKKRNDGQMDQLIGNYGNLTPSAHRNGRTLSGEGVSIAQRNRGCEMDKLIGQYGNLEVSGRPVPRIKSPEAQINANKWNGTASSVIYGD